MEPLERTEKPVNMRVIEAGAVVFDEKDCFFSIAPAAEFDARRIPPRGVFPGIAKQILQEYGDQTFVGNGHTIGGNDAFDVPVTALRQVIENRSGQSAHVNRDILERCARRSREIQQVVDQRGHSSCRGDKLLQQVLLLKIDRGKNRSISE